MKNKNNFFVFFIVMIFLNVFLIGLDRKSLAAEEETATECAEGDAECLAAEEESECAEDDEECLAAEEEAAVDCDSETEDCSAEPAADMEDSATAITCDSGFTATAGVCFPDNTGLSSAPIRIILTNVGSWLMGIFATLAIIAFVISGIQYLTSTGDTEQIESAKKSALYALLGIIIGLSGFVIIQAISRALNVTGYFF